MDNEIQPATPETEGNDQSTAIPITTPQTAAPAPTGPAVAPPESRLHPHRKLIGLLVGFVLIWLAIGFSWYISHHTKPSAANVASTTTTPLKSTTSTTSQPAQGMQLDTSKNYGNKYANGILPVGDGKYTTSGPKQGYVYACTQYAQNLATDNGGASTRGPWFTSNNTEYDINKKAHVEGSVSWQSSFNNMVSGATRTITSNDLPLNHTTGIFPIQSSDPAYAYDRNPNTIKAQSFTYSLPASPSYSATPNCIGGQVGVMVTGVALFSAFDAGGRDAGAWEVQDDCSGHPESNGTYHYHTLSSCIKDISAHTVIGFALDGYPITGPDVGANNILTTSDLDECHGITSSIVLDGKNVTMYHYVMTQDFPYSVSCYRGTATQPPGQKQPARQQGSGQTFNQPLPQGPPPRQQ